MPLLERLIGLETEYAIRFRPREGLDKSPSRFHLYQALIARVGRHVLTAPAKHFKEGVFLANGGAIWFETERPAAGGGLIEGATPECRGPREVLRYQRAQDQLLSQCAHLSDVDGHLSLVKNDRDAQRSCLRGSGELRTSAGQLRIVVDMAFGSRAPHPTSAADVAEHRIDDRWDSGLSGDCRTDLSPLAATGGSSASVGSGFVRPGPGGG